MRKFVTSLFALILSGLAGGLVALWLAIATNANSEYILVFMVSALVTIVATVAFFIAQFVPNPQRAINLAGIVGIALFVLAGIGLIAWTFSQPPGKAQWSGDLHFGAGLILPSIATVIVQWLFVGWRVRRGLRAEAGAGA
ncbi:MULTISPECIES: hypothetical protein [unclassified Mesorhizobium]|uniref:hypothetical protein n=1 Tax=unclassified Mesorhizobium TaxID=325217 RepID=UPI00047B5FAB